MENEVAYLSLRLGGNHLSTPWSSQWLPPGSQWLSALPHRVCVKGAHFLKLIFYGYFRDAASSQLLLVLPGSCSSRFSFGYTALRPLTLAGAYAHPECCSILWGGAVPTRWDKGGLRLEHPRAPTGVHPGGEQIRGIPGLPWSVGAQEAPESRVDTNGQGHMHLPGFQGNGDGGYNPSSASHVTWDKVRLILYPEVEVA